MAKARAYFRGESPEWHRDSLCRGVSRDDLFFPNRESRKAAELAGQEFCYSCPVRLECLQDALAGEVEGIFAATCTSDRRRMDRKRSRVKCPLCHGRSIVHMDATDAKAAEEVCISCGASWRADLFPAPNADVLQMPKPRLPADDGQPGHQVALTA